MPTSRKRISEDKERVINERIKHDTALRVHYFENHKGEIAQRLHELDEEWDLERAIQANAAAIAFAGIAMSALRGRRRWLALPALVTGFLFQQSTQGWSTPAPIMRRLGFRTADEIEEERRALMALRGDFDDFARKEGRGRASLRVARSSD